MAFYPTLITLHILTAGIWIVSLIISPLFNKAINRQKGQPAEKSLISVALISSNIIGSIGAMGLLLTGIILVILNPGYNFFQFSANHWLVSKQIIMIVILFLTFAKLIPSAKKARISMSGNEPLGAETYSNLKAVNKTSLIINILVVVNLLFALTHRFLG